MKKRLIKILLLSLALGSNLQAQTFNNLFRTKDRQENMEAMDTYKFTYGFYLAANNFDYKMVLNPTFLLKPFDYNEFLNVSTKARNYFESQQSVSVSKPEKKQEFFFVKSDYKQIKINFSEILYIEGLKDYVKIYLKDNAKPILTLMSLKKLEEELPSENFMRIHRSFIIGLDKIEAIERNHIVIGKEQIAIAPNYKDSLMEYIGGKSF